MNISLCVYCGTLLLYHSQSRQLTNTITKTSLDMGITIMVGMDILIVVVLVLELLQMRVGDVLSIIEEWVSGNNYLKLYLQYIQHNYPLLVYNHNTNEFLHTDEMYIRGQTDGSNSGSGSGSGGARGRHTPSRTMGGSNSGSSGSTSHNSAMSSKALIVQSNREFFNHLACVYLIETAIVVRHSFAVAANAVVEQSSGSGGSGSVPSSLINSFTYGTLNIV